MDIIFTIADTLIAQFQKPTLAFLIAGAMLAVGQYFTLLFWLTVAMGLMFQLPLVMLAIVKVGLVQHDTLKKNWRWIVLGFFAVSAMLTPPDPFTQLLMAGPMIILYIVGLTMTARVAKARGPQPLAEAEE